MTDEEKLNALELLDFQSITQDVCDKCYKCEDCEGYFSSSCPCYGYWSDILTNALKLEEDLKLAVKHIQKYELEDVSQDLFPMSCIGFHDGHLCSIPYYG